ncbi:uncharacterized protein C1orf109 homolog [Protopterus annectens]|uniref:uncharacterized protein C1orf109 homolog n=1 Tax=Protopterus annectens TaxID=7888 RepID=UPI001CFB0DC3|nr:uncharacterized protein C1orf109 homolog [Protopterus annectens]
MSDKTALLSLHQSLRRCFGVVQQQEIIWNDCLKECTPLLSSLGNLGEQLQACYSVTFENTPLKDFPDLKDRLKHKLTLAMETIFEKLGEKMSCLQKVRDTVSNQVTAVFQHYDQLSAAFTVDETFERSTLTPSLADMLEWLQDIERFYRREYPLL